jgi:hypothetical protein
MHKSILIYAKALHCTPGQVRRYIRQNRIPSARLTRLKVGRPAWAIIDCSPSAIAELKETVAAQKTALRTSAWRVTFHEAVRERTIVMAPNGESLLRHEIVWRPTMRAREWNAIAAGHDVITRLALLRQNLSWEELCNPSTKLDDRGLRKIEPVDQERREAFERKRRKYLRYWITPHSQRTKRMIQRFLGDLARTNIMEAASYLALYYRRYGIAVNHRTLARVLGVSKSSLYRHYGQELVKRALCHARAAAASPTQRDSHDKERSRHPGLTRETHQQAVAPARELL